MTLSLEVREGVSSEERPVAEPDADKARAALRSLDGAGISQLAADDGRGQVLLIGGGNEGRFVVDCLVNVDEHGYHLVDPDGTPEELPVVTGGQLASFPGDRVVSEALAAEALVHFVATGRRAESLIWRQDF